MYKRVNPSDLEIGKFYLRVPSGLLPNNETTLKESKVLYFEKIETPIVKFSDKQLIAYIFKQIYPGNFHKTQKKFKDFATFDNSLFIYSDYYEISTAEGEELNNLQTSIDGIINNIFKNLG